jgi:hypothetical protein
MFKYTPGAVIFRSPRYNTSLVMPGLLKLDFRSGVTYPPVVTAAAPWILNPVTTALQFKSNRALSSELHGDIALHYAAVLNSGHRGVKVLVTDTSCRRADRVTKGNFASAKSASHGSYTMERIGMVVKGDHHG